MDAIETLAAERLRENGIDVEVQLEKGTATRPILWMLVQARARAAKAIVLFIDVDPIDTENIRKLQHEIRLYDDLVQLARNCIERGREADAGINEGDREALEEIVRNMSDEERRLYKLEPRRTD